MKKQPKTELKLGKVTFLGKINLNEYMEKLILTRLEKMESTNT